MNCDGNIRSDGKTFAADLTVTVSLSCWEYYQLSLCSSYPHRVLLSYICSPFTKEVNLASEIILTLPVTC